MSRRTILLAATTALLALTWATAPAYALQLGPTEPHSPNAETISGTYWVMFVIACVLIVVINAAMILAVVRFRERRGREATQVHAGRGALRPILGGLGVLAIAIFVFGVIQTDDARTVEPAGPSGLGSTATGQVGVKGLEAVAITEDASSSNDAAATTSPLVINAIAQQWLWRFEYPGGRPGDRTFTYGQLVVPEDTPVILRITSIDVLHSWSVPALGGQVQATPGQTANTWFKADEVGTYSGASTVFSGTSYPAMRSWVKVVSVPEYEAYIQQLSDQIHQAQDAVVQDEPPPATE